MPAAGVEPALMRGIYVCIVGLCQIPCQNLKLFELRSEIISENKKNSPKGD